MKPNRYPIALVVAVAATLLLTPAQAAEIPEFPNEISTLIEARLESVAPDLQAKITALQSELDENRLVKLLIFDRLTANAQYGQGFTVTNTDGTGETGVKINDETGSSWSVTYKLPFNLLLERRGWRQTTAREIQIARAQLAAARTAAEVEMREIYKEYLQARAKYDDAAGSGAVPASTTPDVGQGYEMRYKALTLLVLAGQKETPHFRRWDRFRPDGSEGTLLAEH